MKRLILFALLILSLKLQAQKNIDGLIKAEKSFAAYSVAYGTKEAFLKFADSNGIVFDEGRAVNAIDSWIKKKKGNGILNWQPQFAEIALSDDFGYTTGPWTFQPNSITDSVVARGQYFTIWYWRDTAWRFLVDLGTNNTPVNSSADISTINIAKRKGNGKIIASVLKNEKKFFEAAKKNIAGAYGKYLSKRHSIVNRNNNLPAFAEPDQKKLIALTPPQIVYKIDGYGMASSGDFAYVYGTTNLRGKEDNYVRVWRKEKARWKIALEVLRY